jgi:hypothetical protein
MKLSKWFLRYVDDSAGKEILYVVTSLIVFLWVEYRLRRML